MHTDSTSSFYNSIISCGKEGRRTAFAIPELFSLSSKTARMETHRCCKALFLCSSSVPTVMYAAVTILGSLALSGVLYVWVDPATSPLDRIVAVILIATTAPMFLVGVTSCCAVTRKSCRSSRVMGVNGAIYALLSVTVLCASGVFVSVSMSGEALREKRATILGYIVDTGCAIADSTCCERYASSFTCLPLQAACQEVSGVNSTATLRGIFTDTLEKSKYYVWGTCGVVSLGVLTVMITSFRLCIAIVRNNKSMEFEPDKELYIVDAFRWDSRGMNGNAKKDATVWVTDPYRVETWPRR